MQEKRERKILIANVPPLDVIERFSVLLLRFAKEKRKGNVFFAVFMVVF